MEEEVTPVPQTKEININLKLNKTRAIIAGVIVAVLVVVVGAYVLGAKSKDGQIKACQEALDAVDDALNDYEFDLDEASDNLEKCDSSYK